MLISIASLGQHEERLPWLQCKFWSLGSICWEDVVVMRVHPIQFNSLKVPCNHTHTDTSSAYTAQRYRPHLHSTMWKCFTTQRMGRKLNAGEKAFPPTTWRYTLAQLFLPGTRWAFFHIHTSEEWDRYLQEPRLQVGMGAAWMGEDSQGLGQPHGLEGTQGQGTYR